MRLCPVSVMQNYCYKGVFGKNGPLVYSEALRVIQELMELYDVDDWKAKYNLHGVVLGRWPEGFPRAPLIEKKGARALGKDAWCCQFL